MYRQATVSKSMSAVKILRPELIKHLEMTHSLWHSRMFNKHYNQSGWRLMWSSSCTGLLKLCKNRGKVIAPKYMLVRDGNSSPKVKHLDGVTKQKEGPAILNYHLRHNCLKLKTEWVLCVLQWSNSTWHTQSKYDIGLQSCKFLKVEDLLLLFF